MAGESGLSSTSRDAEQWARATERARGVRARVGDEVFGVLVNVGAQAEDLLVRADVMGSRSMLGMRIRAVGEAERREEPLAVRAAVMELIPACGAWVGAIDLRMLRTPVAA